MHSSISARSFFMAIFALAIVISLSSTTASASVIISQDALIGGPGWYNGSGGSDGHFTVVTADYGSGNTLQLAERAEVRFVGAFAPTVDNIYVPPAGAQINVDWSVYTTGTLHLTDFTYSLTIADVTSGFNTTFDPSNPALGDAYWGPSGKTLTADPANVGLQNSEYLGFSFIKNAIHYNDGDIITASLFAVPTFTGADPSVEIQINTSAVPEPATFGLAGFALLGLGLLRKKFKV